MQSESYVPTYNERLFGGGIRRWLHQARFLWVSRTIKRYNIKAASVIELGCFDGRAISYLPTPPDLYFGFDANWEGGLDQARRQYVDSPNFHFVEALNPTQMVLPHSNFDLGLSLETIEHIPPELVGPYLSVLSKVIKGHLIVTVPNEKGPLFLLKHLAKRLLLGGAESYTFSQVFAATFGMMHKVPRDQHKGFDWEALVAQIKEHFDIVSIEGVQFHRLPKAINAQIGIVGRSRTL